MTATNLVLRASYLVARPRFVMTLRLFISRAVLLLIAVVISTPVLHAQANGDFFWITRQPRLRARGETC